MARYKPWLVWLVVGLHMTGILQVRAEPAEPSLEMLLFLADFTDSGGNWVGEELETIEAGQDPPEVQRTTDDDSE